MPIGDAAIAASVSGRHGRRQRSGFRNRGFDRCDEPLEKIFDPADAKRDVLERVGGALVGSRHAGRIIVRDEFLLHVAQESCPPRVDHHQILLSYLMAGRGKDRVGHNHQSLPQDRYHLAAAAGFAAMNARGLAGRCDPATLYQCARILFDNSVDAVTDRSVFIAVIHRKPGPKWDNTAESGNVTEAASANSEHAGGLRFALDLAHE